jgi:predicted ATP-grasp superfamily ATP-dependent carboligase
MERLEGPRAIVLDLAHPRAVAVVRSLARAGVEVVGVDHRPNASGYYSKHLARRIRLDTRRGYDGALARALAELASDGGGGLLIPTADAPNVFVARHRERLARHFALCSPHWPVLDLCMDRAASYALASELGIHAPEAFAPADADALEEVLARLEFGKADYVLKTRVWDAPADVARDRYTLAPPPDAASFRAAWGEIAARSRLPPTIERVVPGRSDDCVGVSLVMDDRGEPAVAYAVKRLHMYTYARGGGYRHPYQMGANVYCESVHDEEAMQAALSLARRIGYVGALTVEFRRDPETGVLTFIKLDPRVIRSTSLSALLGVDVPRALYRSFALGERIAPRAYADVVRWMWVSQYVAALRQNASWGGALSETLRMLAILPRVRAFAYLSARDPLPFVKSMVYEVPVVKQPLRRGLRRLASVRIPQLAG